MGKERRFNYLLGLLFFLLFIVVNFVAWRFFFAPTNGLMKLFTPLYGLSLIAMLLFCFLLVGDIFGGAEKAGGPVKGVVLTVVGFVLFYAIYYGFLWNIIGKYGVTYFSPQSIVDAGGTGAEIWNARENSSMAITYLAAAFLFVTILWQGGLGNYPWEELSGLRRGFSKLFGISFFAVIVYAVFFHPHITALFVPKQSFAGVEPWWEDAAMTSSAFYHLGWMMASLAVMVLISETLEGWPLTLFPASGTGRLVRLGAALVISIGAGFVIFNVLHAVMNHYWYEPFLGGNYTDDPRFRHIHVAEISTFAIAAAYLWKAYFGNWPTKLPAPLGHLVRAAIVLLVTGGIWFFFYNENLGPWYVDRVPGIGNIDDTALCWGMMTVAILYAHLKFFAAWPMARGRSSDD